MLIDRIRVPGRTQPGHQSPSLASLDSIHRVQVEVAERHALFLRDRVARRRRGCSAVGKLRKIVVDNSGYNAFAQILVTHVQPARVLAEFEAMPSMRPDQIVIDLPLRHLAALRVRLIVPANRGEGRVGTPAGKHNGKGIEHLRIVVGKKKTRIPAHAGEAERLEHFISERFEERIEAKLGYPKIDPHGHCIPAMDGKVPKENSVPLTDMVAEGTVVVDSISDRDAAIVKSLRMNSIAPGVQLRVRNRHADGGYSVRIGRSGKVLHLSHEAADAIRVHP
jgi:hypothetical protein